MRTMRMHTGLERPSVPKQPLGRERHQVALVRWICGICRSVTKEGEMFVVVIASIIQYVGSRRGANGFDKLCLMAGDQPLVRKARTGETAAYQIALRSDQSLPAASA